MLSASDKRNGPLIRLLLFVTFAICLQKVSCVGSAQVKLVSYSNPRGELDNGVCCDQIPLFGCESGGGCDHYFIICIDETTNTALNDLTTCTFGSVQTAQTPDTANITFGSEIGSLLSGKSSNPISFSLAAWPSEVLVKVQVWDDDLAISREKVDFMKSNPLRIAPALATDGSAQWTNVTIQNRTTLKIQVRVSCAVNYYGAGCNVLCMPGGTKYTCGRDGAKSCSPGWTGVNCDAAAGVGTTAGSKAQATTASPCGICINGQCIDGSCSCSPGYTGDNCETDIDDCAGVDCHHGTCIDRINQHRCLCTPGYIGAACDQLETGCGDSPCRHGGTCQESGGEITCSCSEGWTGQRCQRDVDECMSNICRHSVGCLNTDGGFVCTCQRGWTGLLCDANIDECQSQPCANGGVCTDGINSYTCQCTDGWTPESNCLSSPAPPTQQQDSSTQSTESYTPTVSDSQSTCGEEPQKEKKSAWVFRGRLSDDDVWSLLRLISSMTIALDADSSQQQSPGQVFVYYEVGYLDPQSSAEVRTVLFFRVTTQTRGGSPIPPETLDSRVGQSDFLSQLPPSFASIGDAQQLGSLSVAERQSEKKTTLSELDRRLDIGAIVVISVIVLAVIIGAIVACTRQPRQKWEYESQTMDPVLKRETAKEGAVAKEEADDSSGPVGVSGKDTEGNSVTYVIDSEDPQPTAPHIYVMKTHGGHKHHSKSSSSSSDRSSYDQIGDEGQRVQ